MLDLISQQWVHTLVLAAAYALFAAGFILIFGVLDVLNLAHAFVFMFCASVAVWLASRGHPLAVAMLGALGVSLVLGFLLDRVAFRPLVGRRIHGGFGFQFTPVVSTLGVAFILQGVAQRLFGIENKAFPTDIVPAQTFTVFGSRVTVMQIVIVVTAVVVLVALHLVLRRTAFGKAVRAVAENRDMAELLGVNSPRMYTAIWVIGSALAAVAGVFIGIIFRAVSPNMGATFEIKGFIAVIIGGIGSVPGAVIAAVLLAVLETGSVLWASSEFRDVITLTALLGLLILRPYGLFGRKARSV